MLAIHGQLGWEVHWLYEIRLRTDSAWLIDEDLRADWDCHNPQGGLEFVRLIQNLADWYFDNCDRFVGPGDDDADASEDDDSARDDVEPAAVEWLESAGG